MSKPGEDAAPSGPDGSPPPKPPSPPSRELGGNPPPPEGSGNIDPTSAFHSAFDDRQGIYQFQANSKEWGYVPQLHEWAQKEHKPLEWVITRVGGKAHLPEFEAYPLWNGQRLTDYTRRGPSKQKAKEASAEAMAKSGHC